VKLAPKQTYEVEFDLPGPDGEATEHLVVVWARSASDAIEVVKARHPDASHLDAELYP
jgi:hypothetical protein